METEFGTRLRELRKAAKLTQKELSRKAGDVSLSTIQKLEQGLFSPSWETVRLLAGALRCTPNDFLPGKPK